MKQEVLNELYFGKSLTTQHLQDSFDCLQAIINNNPTMEIQTKLNKINSYIYPIIQENIKEKMNFINGYTSSNSTTNHLYNTTRNINRNNRPLKAWVDEVSNLANDIILNSKTHKEINIATLPANNQLIQYNLSIIENLIRIMFGYNMVFMRFTESKIKGETIFPQTTVLIMHEKNSTKIMDDFSRVLENDDIINSINVMNHSIYIDWRKYAVSIVVFLPIQNIKDRIFTSSELLAIILHEIGHTFSKLLTPHINLNITSRQDEKFADKMVTLYGYGNELITALAKLQSFDHMEYFQQLKSANSPEKMKDKKKVAKHIYTNTYDNRKTGISEKDAKQIMIQINIKLTFLNNQLQNSNLTPLERDIIEEEIKKVEEIKENIKDNVLDTHPLTYLRMWDQLRQLSSELTSPHNTDIKKKKIIDDISKIKQSIRDYHKGNLHSEFINNHKDSDDFKDIDNEIRKLMHRGDRKKMAAELNGEKDNPLPAEDITNLFDSLYVDTKRKTLMINNFKEFWKEYTPEDKNKITNPNICTKLFEKFLVTKYEKYNNESITEYCQRIIRMKIIELCKMKLDPEYKRHIKISNGISKKILSNGMYNTEFQYKKLEDDDSNILDFYYDDITNENKVFISPCRFNSNGDLENIAYDKDEMRRIENLYNKYYT